MICALMQHPVRVRCARVQVEDIHAEICSIVEETREASMNKPIPTLWTEDWPGSTPEASEEEATTNASGATTEE